MSKQKIIIGYSIQCDEELNSPDAIARNEFRARITIHYVEFSEEEFERSDNVR